MKTNVLMLTLILGTLSLAIFSPPACAQNATPHMIFHARFWNTIPGWEPRPGDAAYIEFTPTGNTAADVEAIMSSPLGDVPPAQRMLGTNSIKHIDMILEQLIKVKGFGLSFLGYDLERRPQTPLEEQDDPVTACQNAKALAQKYALIFLIVPTANLSAEFGERLAPLADWFQAQGKGYQAYDTSLAVYRQRQVYKKLRAANSDVIIYHDMAMVPKGKELPLADLLDYYYGCSDMVAGNSIWALPQHRAILETYVLTVRPPTTTPPAGARAPVITLPPAASNTIPLVGERVSFKITAEDPGGQALTYTWDFGDHREWGDGNVLVRGQEVNHVYSFAGDFEVTVKVTDGKGGVVRDSLRLKVTVDPTGPMGR